jgi:hypothetical protein
MQQMSLADRALLLKSTPVLVFFVALLYQQLAPLTDTSTVAAASTLTACINMNE